MRIWLFRTFLIFVLVSVGGLGWFALQAQSLTTALDPTLAALATGLGANTATGSPTLTAGPPTESPTPAPTLSSEFGTLILALRVSGRTHLQAYLPGASDPIPLTSGDWDDRDPSLSPDGTKIAFASNREGGWDLIF